MSEAIINQPWEDVADDVTGAIEKAVQPLLKKAVDDIYGGLLDATQDYLKDNLAFNIASRISTAEREASYARRKVERLEAINAELLRELGNAVTLLEAAGVVETAGGTIRASRAAIASAQRIIGEGE